MQNISKYSENYHWDSSQARHRMRCFQYRIGMEKGLDLDIHLALLQPWVLA
jgi:hypothetical protein